MTEADAAGLDDRALGDKLDGVIADENLEAALADPAVAKAVVEMTDDLAAAESITPQEASERIGDALADEWAAEPMALFDDDPDPETWVCQACGEEIPADDVTCIYEDPAPENPKICPRKNWFHPVPSSDPSGHEPCGPVVRLETGSNTPKQAGARVDGVVSHGDNDGPEGTQRWIACATAELPNGQTLVWYVGADLPDGRKSGTTDRASARRWEFRGRADAQAAADELAGVLRARLGIVAPEGGGQT